MTHETKTGDKRIYLDGILIDTCTVNSVTRRNAVITSDTDGRRRVVRLDRLYTSTNEMLGHLDYLASREDSRNTAKNAKP